MLGSSRSAVVAGYATANQRAHACAVAVQTRGPSSRRARIYATWYPEGSESRPDLYFAVADNGRRFGQRRQVHTSATSIPDHARMVVDRQGRAVIVWEASTAVRRRILLRYTVDGGRTLSPI